MENSYTERTKTWISRFGDVTIMFFDKLDRLVSETVKFTDNIIDSTVLCLFTEIRAHNPWIRFQHNNIQREYDLGVVRSTRFAFLSVQNNRLNT
jgi:hypothetical protein